MNKAHIITLATVDSIDLFTRKQYCRLISKSLRYYQKSYGLMVHAFVIMPSHIRIVASQPEGVLQQVMNSFKAVGHPTCLMSLSKSMKHEEAERLLNEAYDDAVETIASDPDQYNLDLSFYYVLAKKIGD